MKSGSSRVPLAPTGCRMSLLVLENSQVTESRTNTILALLALTLAVGTNMLPFSPSQAASLDAATVDEFPNSEVSRLTATGLGKFSHGDFAGAANEFSKAISINPKKGELFLQRGLSRLEGEDYTNALVDFNTAYELDKPNRVHVLICRGRTLAALGKNTEALADLDKAIEMEPKIPLSYINRADVYLSEGEDERAIRDLEHALKLDPEQAKAYLVRARYYKKRKENELALKDFNTAVKLDSNLIDFEKGPDCHTTRELREHFSKSLKLKSDMTAEMVERGMAMERAGEYLGAIKEFTDAISDSPDSLEAYRWRANVYMHMSAFSHAIDDLTSAIAISPDDASLYALRGKAYLEIGKMDHSILDYTKAIAIGKDSLSGLYEARGLVYSRIGNSDKAIADFSKSIELDPKASTAYADRGLEYLLKNQHQQALTDFSASIERGHDLAVSYKFGGQCRHALGDVKGAIADLEKAGQIYKEHNDLFGSRQVEKLILNWKKEPGKT